MTTIEPQTKLDDRFSDKNATALPWETAVARLDSAEIYYLTTVRPDGRPHVTPLPAVWMDDALHFCTGETEQKTKNLDRNPHCILTTGSNALRAGVDIVFEGDTVRVSDESTLRRLAALYLSKFDWPYEVRDGSFIAGGTNVAVVYRVDPKTVFGFGKGEPFSQTRWRF